jgi:hypothetical protein
VEIKEKLENISTLKKIDAAGYIKSKCRKCTRLGVAS